VRRAGWWRLPWLGQGTAAAALVVAWPLQWFGIPGLVAMLQWQLVMQDTHLDSASTVTPGTLMADDFTQSALDITDLT
jgi:hypothetical protein